MRETGDEVQTVKKEKNKNYINDHEMERFLRTFLFVFKLGKV